MPSVPRQTQVRYFHVEDEPGARRVQQLLGQHLGVQGIELTRIPGFESKVPVLRYEVWFAPGDLPATAVVPAAR